MAYIPTNWENDPESSTPIDADNLNKMEQGIFDAHAQCAIAINDATNAMEGVRELQGLSYAPIPITVASEMTDISRIYVYIGNEPGMQNNYWYYYNGSVWVPGGIYNAVTVVLDKTLEHDGEAADAKAVGDAIKAFGGVGIHIMPVITGTTISNTDIEISYLLFETARDNENVLVNGMICGTISLANAIVNISILSDGVEMFTYSQVCIAGLNAIPIIVGMQIEKAGNHIISIECNMQNGSFTI